MFGLLKKALILILVSAPNSLNAIPSKNQECEARKVLISNESLSLK